MIFGSSLDDLLLEALVGPARGERDRRRRERRGGLRVNLSSCRAAAWGGKGRRARTGPAKEAGAAPSEGAATCLADVMSLMSLAAL